MSNIGEHVWAEIQITVIEPELMADGSIDVHAQEEAIAAGVEAAKRGCMVCGLPLNTHTIERRCGGPEV